MADIFISYSRHERETLDNYIEELERRGFTLWTDLQAVPGENFRQAVNDHLMQDRSMLLLWSGHAAGSHCVLEEIGGSRRRPEKWSSCSWMPNRCRRR